MSILNITPDSFSDGGKLAPTDLDTIVATARSHIAHGATILDVGGQSTRPNATMLPAEEELGRVLPALRAIRTIPEVANGEIAISLDTFYSDVARPCIEEGLVDIINDISAGRLDHPKMLSTVAHFKKTIVLMHMRGDPQTMTKLTDYGQQGVVKMVARKLAGHVKQALTAGIPPWRIILDPGIGFAKDQQQNLELLRTGTDGIATEWPRELARHPWLVGTSRKGFIRRITESPSPGERVWGTAACVTAAVAGGARIVRVHDVEEMSKVARMADALYRVEEKEDQNEKELDREEVIDKEKEESNGLFRGNRNVPNQETLIASTRQQNAAVRPTDADLLLRIIERLQEQRADPNIAVWETRTTASSNISQTTREGETAEMNEYEDPVVVFDELKNIMRRQQRELERLERIHLESRQQYGQESHEQKLKVPDDHVDFPSEQVAPNRQVQTIEEQKNGNLQERVRISRREAAQKRHLKVKGFLESDLKLPRKQMTMKSEDKHEQELPDQPTIQPRVEHKVQPHPEIADVHMNKAWTDGKGTNPKETADERNQSPRPTSDLAPLPQR